MKIRYKKQASGFTLIEMIGVLAVIAILAALLIPKIFEAIASSRVSNATISIGTCKTAMADHYAKFGSLAYNGGAATPAPITSFPANDFDQILLTEGFIDKPLEVKVSDNTGTMVRLVQNDDTAATAVAYDDSGTYNLDGAGNNNDMPNTIVAEAVLTGVTLEDALELSKRIDGTSLSAAGTAATDHDPEGRVKYSAGANPTTVFVYLTHR